MMIVLTEHSTRMSHQFAPNRLGSQIFTQKGEALGCFILSLRHVAVSTFSAPLMRLVVWAWRCDRGGGIFPAAATLGARGDDDGWRRASYRTAAGVAAEQRNGREAYLIAPLMMICRRRRR